MFLELLYFLTIRPLEILFETIFFISYRFIGKPFATIIALSIFVNILVFPLYKRADKLQSEQRAREKAMEGQLSHIKKTFKGDERVMMTQAYYRLSGYKPVYALRGASSLLLQIPFFIAAYRFLSNLEMIKGMPSILLPLSLSGGVPAYLIKDLGSPDAMLTLNGHAVNVLPILMTLINIISGTIYSKGHLRKEKIQLYVTALVFLVLLYNSPAGLVIYWTCNNIFSLLKNAVQKVFEKSAGKISAVRKSKENGTLQQAESLSALGHSASELSVQMRVYNSIFILCAILMALMTGLFIPSNILSASASDFVSLLNDFNPSKYLIYSFSLSAGFFVVWIGIYYLFSQDSVRKIFSCIMTVVCAASVINYMMSGSGLGILSSDLKYDSIPSFQPKQIFLNIALIVLSTVCVLVIYRIKPVVARYLLMAGCAALICVSFVSIAKTNSDYKSYKEMVASSGEYDEQPQIKLSRTGRNVVYIMLDRATSAQIIYAINERPDLIEKYDGFTFYHDTVSYGGFTNFGMPPAIGGYEYTPYEMNKRADESLKDKTNEALRVLPVLFSNNGYGVTVFDPPLANYNYNSDLSIYDDYPGIKGYISKGKFTDSNGEDVYDMFEKRKRNFFYFGLTKSVPLFMQNALYDEGYYNSGDNIKSLNVTGFIESGDEYNAKLSVGYSEEFYAWYSVLDNLTNITTIDENEKGEFLMMYNCTTHEPNILQLPDYRPQMYVDNTAYSTDRYYELNGVRLNMDSQYAVETYHVNMASLLRIGEWLDYLKEEGVYDNTRIVIVADHGSRQCWFDHFKIGDWLAFEYFLPLFMVKDFDAHGFEISTDFMTNADAAVMTVSGDVVEEAVNPFTGKALDGHQKYEDIIRVTINSNLNAEEFHDNTFTPGAWYSVKDTPYDPANWEYLYFE